MSFKVCQSFSRTGMDFTWLCFIAKWEWIIMVQCRTGAVKTSVHRVQYGHVLDLVIIERNLHGIRVNWTITHNTLLWQGALPVSSMMKGSYKAEIMLSSWWLFCFYVLMYVSQSVSLFRCLIPPFLLPSHSVSLFVAYLRLFISVKYEVYCMFCGMVCYADIVKCYVRAHSQ